MEVWCWETILHGISTHFVIAFVEDSVFKDVLYSESLEAKHSVKGQICFLTHVKKQSIVYHFGQSLSRIC